MATAPSMLGPYRIDRELGRGGMGIVYLAHDTRLDRRVAIKALPEDVASDPDRLARFEREARVLASLNHPNLASIYDLQEADGRRYLAMEYIEGESLADRLREGPLPMAEAIEIGQQIAAGMEAAHEGGVVHRDLKPANVMLAAGERVKVVDFGLAKGRVAAEDPTPRGHAVSPVLASSPTLESPGTIPGVILGTAGYLSPEQARGRTVDRRTDIWSFGCILYECLTGRKLFEGETVSDTIANILARPLDLSGLPAATPPRVRELIERCLEKDPRKRLRDIGEAALLLEQERAGVAKERTIPAATAAPPAVSRRRIGVRQLLPIAGALAAALLAWNLFGAGVRAWLRGPAPQVARLSVSIPAELQAEYGKVLISPDGTMLVALARPREGSGVRETRLYRRRIDGTSFEPVPGTEGAVGWGFSADGRWIGVTVWSEGSAASLRLIKVPTDGSAPPIAISAWDPNWQSATWLRSGDLLVGDRGKRYVRISPRGEAAPPRGYGISDTSRNVELRRLLPNDRGVLLDVQGYAGGAFRQDVWVLDLETGKAKMLIQDGGSAAYSTTGHVLFTRQGTLLGVPFDLRTLAVNGAPVALMDGLSTTSSWENAEFSISRNGTLVFPPGRSSGTQRRLVIVDRSGNATEWSSDRQAFVRWPAPSPDGTRIATIVSNGRGLFEVWVVDRGGKGRRISDFENGDCFRPLWSPDGRSIAYAQINQTSQDGIYLKDPDGPEPARRVAVMKPGTQLIPTSFARDGRSILAAGGATREASKLYLVPIAPSGSAPSASPIVPEIAQSGSLSPDGRWIVYSSTASGPLEVYVRALLPGPVAGPAIPVSTGGGRGPQWSADGTRVYYASGRDEIVEATLETRPRFRVLSSRKIWDLTALRSVQSTWDIHPNGSLVTIQKGEDEGEVAQLDFVLNFGEELKRKLGKGR